MSLSGPKLLERVGGKGKPLPALATSVTRILRALDDDLANAQDIADLMASDISIAARVLAVSNSVMYNPSGTPFASLSDAVARIGFNEVRNIVVTTGVIDAFSAVDCPFDYMGFWKHCLTSAIAAGTLAGRSPKIDLGGSPGDNPYFVAGLMHDVGIFMLVQCQSRKYEKVLNDAVERHTTLMRAEHDKLGYTHAEVGAALIQEWGLPEGVSVAAEFHHNPTDAPAEFATWAQVIHLADWIADHEGLGVSVEGVSAHFAEGTWFDLGIGVDEIPDVIADFTLAAERSEMMLALVEA